MTYGSGLMHGARIMMVLIMIVAFLSGCDDNKKDDNNLLMALLLDGRSATFTSANTPGQVVPVTAGTASFNMVYANNMDNIVFPDWGDIDATTLTLKFFIGQTEVTNSLAAVVFQWAYNNGKFSDTVGDHNGIDATTMKYGGQELLDLNGGCKIIFTPATHVFSVTGGYENHPVMYITWYGAIMFCNWLTEMQDGGTANIVYTGIDTDWTHTETSEDASKTGYRLPSNSEWNFAARYIGQTVPTIEDLASNYIAQNVHSGNASLTAGYFWTPVAYASGAIKDYNDAVATGTVAWYFDNSGFASHAVATRAANQLGLYDMSGNASEWSYTPSGGARATRGGSFFHTPDNVKVGTTVYYPPTTIYEYLGFRIVKTQ
jgi:formylglycine-generating enzyme required for sulfatase activity